MTDLIATANVVEDPSFPGMVTVQTVWSGDVDRPITQSTCLRASEKKLIQRLVSAIDSQRVYTNPTIRTDTGGKTYVGADCHVFGRTLNADLKRLGF